MILAAETRLSSLCDKPIIPRELGGWMNRGGINKRAIFYYPTVRYFGDFPFCPPNAPDRHPPGFMGTCKGETVTREYRAGILEQHNSMVGACETLLLLGGP